MRGGGTGLLISNELKFDPLPFLTGNSPFESHVITNTHMFWDGTPLKLLSGFNIHLEKPQSIDLYTMLASLDLKQESTISTHR